MNVHEFLEYRMEKTAKESRLDRFTQGLNDMIELPRYSQSVKNPNVALGAGFGGLAGSVVDSYKLGKQPITPEIAAMTPDQLKSYMDMRQAKGVGKGAALGGGATVAYNANKIRLRRKLAKSRRAKALAALGVTGIAGLTASKMRNKKR